MKAANAKLSMRDISIEFPGVKALSNVDFDLESGQIRALIGANGAGKSTLMKVLSGVNSHYSGKIFIDGEECEIRSPKAAKNLGIEIVYQEVDVALVPYLTVGENIMLNTLANKMEKKQAVNWNFIRKTAKEALARLGMDIDVRKPVSELSLAEKQMVLIARAVVEECKFLILDEPTAPLSNTETENFFKIVRNLAQTENVGIVFISHRLAELFEICEHITIMKDGMVVKDMPITKELTINQIVEYMLGRKFDENYPKQTVDIGDVLLDVKNLTERDNKVKNIDMQVRKGEIVALAGLVGAGKTELCKTLFGAYRTCSGDVTLDGKKINPKNPTQAVARGLALVPEERRKEGVLVTDPLYANITISSLNKFLSKIRFVSKSRQRDAARTKIKELGIKTPSENQVVALLSGGNQQKVVVGKWLVSDSEIYIFDEPTKGVDVGAKRDIFQLIEGLASQGKGVIYASCEFSEILAIADRVYVMFDGEIVKEMNVKDTNEKELLYYSTGGR
jgi:simple sugar transport system ATP-binding protein